MYKVRTPNLVKNIYTKIIWDVPSRDNILYLTFDDGPNRVITPWVLQTLQNFKAKATFFCVGNNVEKYNEVYTQIIEEGHVVGNHTYDHLNGWKTRKDVYLDNVNKCKKVIKSRLFRPPYGKLRKSHYENLKKEFTIVMWDVISGDFDRRTSNKKCLLNVVNNAKKGSVVVFHDSEKALKKLHYTLPRVLEHFSNQGFVFKSLSAI